MTIKSFMECFTGNNLIIFTKPTNAMFDTEKRLDWSISADDEEWEILKAEIKKIERYHITSIYPYDGDTIIVRAAKKILK